LEITIFFRLRDQLVKRLVNVKDHNSQVRKMFLKLLGSEIELLIED